MTEKPKALGSFFKGVRAYLNDPGRVASADLQSAWMQAAGPTVSERTRVKSVAGGVLRVIVPSGALKAELQGFRQRELLGKMRALAPGLGLREIRFLTETE